MKDDRLLALLAAPAQRPQLRALVRGIEKESLRVTPTGLLSRKPHPRALGSALTHPHITTDYSEALLEFITPTSTRVSDSLDFLDELHRYTYSAIDDELLWCASMPCVLADDANIPVAEYGNSHIGQLKHIYRLGLGHRYGRAMQTIAGIHYNFSLPDALWAVLQEEAGDRGTLQDFKTQRYFDLIRNFRRHFWLLLYLYGASPALCRSFLGQRAHDLEPFDDGSLYRPWATSLRMSDLGYQSAAQAGITVTYNDLDNYIEALARALRTPHPDYERIGVRVDGGYRQISTALLQIENEYYSPIRPKRVTRSAEMPLHALSERGVEYIEVRCLDLNPFLPLGIDAEQIRFLDLFLVGNAIWPSPPMDRDDCRAIHHNQAATAREGRKPGLELVRNGSTLELRQWGFELLDRLAPLAELFDAAHQGDAYHKALAGARARLEDPETTPAAQLLARMREAQVPFFSLAMALSEAHGRDMRARPLEPERQAFFAAAAEQSLEDQARLEANPGHASFEAFLQAYLNQPIRAQLR